MLVEAITYRFRGHSMADPEEYRTKEQVAEWRSATRSRCSPRGCVEEGVLDEASRGGARRGRRSSASTRAVAFADASPFPAPESLYDDVYVLGDQVRGWYSVDERCERRA